MQKRRRGRPRKPRSPQQFNPDVLRGTVQEIRKMTKEYSNGDLFFDVQYIEKKRPRLLKNAGISTTDCDGMWKVHYDQERVIMLPEKDQKLIHRYVSSKENIRFLEQTVDSISDEKIRNFASDVLLDGNNILDLVDKYGVSSRTLWRWKKEILENTARKYLTIARPS